MGYHVVFKCLYGSFWKLSGETIQKPLLELGPAASDLTPQSELSQTPSIAPWKLHCDWQLSGCGTWLHRAPCQVPHAVMTQVTSSTHSKRL